MKRLGLLGGVLAGALSVVFLSHASPVTAASSGQCSGGGDCVVLKVDIGVKPGTAAKVVATRSNKVTTGRDDLFTLDLDGDNQHYSSKNVIFGTDINGPYCSSANPATIANVFYDITVSGSANGVRTRVNLCSNASPNATGSFPAVKSIVVASVAGKRTTGGILADITIIQDVTGTKLACPKNSAFVLTDQTGAKLDFTVNEQPTSSIGRLYTNYVLKPGTYTIDGTCVINGKGYIVRQVGIKVTADTITHITKTTAGDAAVPIDPAAGTAAGTAAAEIKPTCDVDSLTWVFCPLISVAQKAVEELGGIVKDQLEFSPLKDDSTGLKPAWEAFRNIADVFFVLIFFVVIFGTSMGFDNYTVKKILPRLIAAAVLIQFSYLLVGLLVDISNVLGKGIDSLMYAAIPAAAKNGNSGGSLIAGSIEAVILGLVGGYAAFTAGFAVPLLLALVSALLGLIAVFLTLQIRLMLISFLIVLAPVAILLWVLPNTEKYFKIWRETLIKLLLMYPIIVLLLATSSLFSVIIANSGDAATNFQKLLGAMAPILAFFLIPTTFKYAGKSLGAVSSFASRQTSRGQKGIDGLKGKSKQNRAYNREQKSLSRINALNKNPATTKGGKAMQGLQRRYAQAGAGFGLDKIDESQINNRLRENDKKQLEAAARKLDYLNPDQLRIVAASSNDYGHRAAVAKMAETNDLAGLQQVLTASNGRYKDNQDPDWQKAIAGNYKQIKEQAPHLVMPPSKAFENLSAQGLSQLNELGIAGLTDYRNSLSGTQQKDFDTKTAETFTRLDNSQTLMNSLKPEYRTKLNTLAAAAGYTILGTGTTGGSGSGGSSGTGAGGGRGPQNFPGGAGFGGGNTPAPSAGGGSGASSNNPSSWRNSGSNPMPGGAGWAGGNASGGAGPSGPGGTSPGPSGSGGSGQGYTGGGATQPPTGGAGFGLLQTAYDKSSGGPASSPQPTNANTYRTFNTAGSQAAPAVSPADTRSASSTVTFNPPNTSTAPIPSASVTTGQTIVPPIPGNKVFPGSSAPAAAAPKITITPPIPGGQAPQAPATNPGVRPSATPFSVTPKPPSPTSVPDFNASGRVTIRPTQPGSRTNGPLPSLRLGSRAESSVPGDDRSRP